MATKILYVITKANWGGAQRYVYDLAVAAQEHGYMVAVAVGEEGILTDRLAAANIRTLHLALRQQKTFIGDLVTFGPLFSLIRIFRSEQPTIVHVNSAKAGGLGALAARMARVPHIIFTAHGWEFNAPRSTLSKIGIRFFSWLTMLLAHQTIAVSEAIRENVRTWPSIDRRITTIHNGIACPRLYPRTEARTRLAPQATAGYWIGMISELNPTKRVRDALIAFSSLASAQPQAVLVVIGDGHERGALEQLVRELHLGDRVVLAGFRADAASLLPAFDLFIHTSSSEALGYVILEAGCAGVPVIATQVGGIPEIIPDATYGILVPPRNPAALAAAIAALMHNPSQATTLGMHLQERVRTAFSKEEMLRETFALYAR